MRGIKYLKYKLEWLLQTRGLSLHNNTDHWALNIFIETQI